MAAATVVVAAAAVVVVAGLLAAEKNIVEISDMLFPLPSWLLLGNRMGRSVGAQLSGRKSVLCRRTPSPSPSPSPSSMHWQLVGTPSRWECL